MNTRMPESKRNNVCFGLAKYMDIILVNTRYIIYNTSIKDAKTIYINTRLFYTLIIMFINKILPQLDHKVNIIIAGEDFTFPNNIDLRYKRTDDITLSKLKSLCMHKYINKLFIENLDEELPNTYPIPLGINKEESPVNNEYFLQYEDLRSNKPLKITNFNRTRTGDGQWKERGDVAKFCENEWKSLYIHTGNIKRHPVYLKELSKYQFTLCVHGGGLDVNPKLFEAILVGVIPIIKKNEPYTNIYTDHDLPVVIIDEWDTDTITMKNLEKWYDKYILYFTDVNIRKRVLNCLTIDYWVNYVSYQ